MPDCDGSVPECFHMERYMNRNGREVWRKCVETPVEQIEGYWFCSVHLPPGPKAA